jgi:hypothetical protein
MIDIKDETEITATITVGQRAYGVPLDVAKQFAAWGAYHKSIREALEKKDTEIERLKKAVSDAQQESFFVREYLDEARDWFRQIMEEAEDCPNTIEEWRDGLCSGSVGVVVNFCKAAMSEIPEGGDVVFLVRQRIEDAMSGKALAGGEDSREYHTTPDHSQSPRYAGGEE